MNYIKIRDLTIDKKGHYGIGASSSTYNQEYPQYLRITDINDSGYAPQKLSTSIDINYYPDWKKYLLHKYDIVFARTGNSTGRNFMFINDNIPTVFAGFLIKFSIDKKKINPRYLAYYCQSKSYWNQVKSLFTGSTRNNINAEQYSELKIPIYDLRLQQHIVNTIGTIDDLLEYKQKIIDKLKEYSTLLYKGYSAIESINKINLGDCCTIKTGKINADQAVINGKYFFFTCGKEDLYINDYVFNCKAIIISGNGEISVKYYDGKFNAYQRTYVLEPQKYFYIFLKECELSIEDLKMNSQGSVIKFITKGMLEKISISINDNSNILNEKLKNIYNDISIINNEIRLLNKIKTKLLAKYF